MTLLESVLNFIEKLCREAVTAEGQKPVLRDRKKVAEYVKSLDYKLWVQKCNIFEYAFVQAENMLVEAAASFTAVEKKLVRERLVALAGQYPENAFVKVNLAITLTHFQ